MPLQKETLKEKSLKRHIYLSKKKIPRLLSSWKIPCSVHWSSPKYPSVIHKNEYLININLWFEVSVVVLSNVVVFWVRHSG
jgi:hypothetical protein